MNPATELLIIIFISYLLGSISGGMLMGKLKQVDIRKMGSGNTGGTNAFRTMGSKFALAVLFIDVIKGFIAVQFVSQLYLNKSLPMDEINIEILKISCGCGVEVGGVAIVIINETTLEGGASSPSQSPRALPQNQTPPPIPRRRSRPPLGLLRWAQSPHRRSRGPSGFRRWRGSSRIRLCSHG